MVRSNTFANPYLDLFLKGLQLSPDTAYELHFDALGAPCFVWCEKSCIAKWSAPFVTRYSDEWRSYCLPFVTGKQMYYATNWGISFNKQWDVTVAAARHATYIDNVHLYRVDDPDTDLLDGGDFEAPRGDNIYRTNWEPSFLGATGTAYGVDIVTDPLCENNRCLRLPSILRPPQYPNEVTLRANSFGFFQSLQYNIRDEELHGLPQHRLLFVKEGALRGTVGNQTVYVRKEHVLYIPPYIPTDFVYTAGKPSVYYWLHFDGPAAAELLAACELKSVVARSVLSVSALSDYIDNMLNTPTEDLFYPYIVNSNLQLLLAELHRQRRAERDREYHPLIEQIATSIREHPEQFISNAELAQRCGFSEGHFVRLFKKYKHCTPHQFQVQSLMEKACALLAKTELSIQEIAFSLGFDDPLYFSRLFRNTHGISPRFYRETHK